MPCGIGARVNGTVAVLGGGHGQGVATRPKWTPPIIAAIGYASAVAIIDPVIRGARMATTFASAASPDANVPSLI